MHNSQKYSNIELSKILKKIMQYGDVAINESHQQGFKV